MQGEQELRRHIGEVVLIICLAHADLAGILIHIAIQFGIASQTCILSCPIRNDHSRANQLSNRLISVLGHYKLTDLRPEHFRKLYADLRQAKSDATGKPLSESTVEGVHATLCSILSDAVEGGFLTHNPAWRTYRYAGKKTEKKIADEETAQKIISALENESIKYETYFKLIIATGMRRGECCAL